jgi:TP901 family phage tail tape measure protein
VQPLGWIFSATDQATRIVSNLTRNMRVLRDVSTEARTRIASATKSSMAGLAGMTGGGAALRGGKALADAYGPFEHTLAGVGVVAQATEKQMAGLEDLAIRESLATGFVPEQTAGTIQELVTAGQSLNDVYSTLGPTMRLAKASMGQLKPEQAASAIQGTIQSFGMATKDSELVADKLLKISQLTNLMPKDFEAGLAKASATAGVFGGSLDNMLILLGQLRNRNIDASSSSTAYREATRRVFTDAEIRNRVEEAGIDVYDRKTGAARDIVDILMDMVDASKEMTEADKNLMIGQVNGARGLLAFSAIEKATYSKTMADGTEITLKGRDAIMAQRLELEAATGTTSQYNSKLNATYEGQKALLKASWASLGVVAGEAFANFLTPMIGAATDAVNAIIEAVRAAPEPLKSVAVAAFMGAAGLATLGGSALIARGALILLQPVVMRVKRAVLGLLFGFGPFGAVLGLLGAAFALFAYGAGDDIGGLTTEIVEFADNARLAISSLFTLLTKGEIVEPKAVEALKNNQGVLTFVRKVSRWLARGGEAWDSFVAGVQAGLEQFNPLFEEAAGAVRWLNESLFAAVQPLDGASEASDGLLTAAYGIGFYLPTLIKYWALYRVAILVGTALTWAHRAAVVASYIAYGVYRGVIWTVKGVQWALNAALLASNPALIGLVSSAFAAGGAMLKLGAAQALAGGAAAASTGIAAKMIAALGAGGLVAAAGAAGVALGMLIDHYTGLSDILADALGNLTGLNDELDRAAGVEQTKQRGSSHLLTAQQRKAAQDQEAKESATSNALTKDWAQSKTGVTPEALALQTGLSAEKLAEEMAKLTASIEMEQRKHEREVTRRPGKGNVTMDGKRVGETVDTRGKHERSRSFGRP